MAPGHRVVGRYFDMHRPRSGRSKKMALLTEDMLYSRGVADGEQASSPRPPA